MTLLVRNQKSKGVAQFQANPGSDRNGNAQPPDVYRCSLIEQFQKGFLVVNEFGKHGAGIGCFGRHGIFRRLHFRLQGTVSLRQHQLREISAEPASLKSCGRTRAFTRGNRFFDRRQVIAAVIIQVFEALGSAPLAGRGLLSQHGGWQHLPFADCLLEQCFGLGLQIFEKWSGLVHDFVFFFDTTKVRD